MPNLRAQERSDLAGRQLFLQPGMREAFSIPLALAVFSLHAVATTVGHHQDDPS